MITVVNMRDPVVKVAMKNRDKRFLYCGRGSRWHGLPTSPFANPFPIAATDTRDVVITKFREYISRRPDLIEALAQKVKADGVEFFVCWCAPEPCHCDVLVELHAEYRHAHRS